MSSIEFITHVMVPEDLDRSHITDVEIVTIGGTDMLFSSTRFDGILSRWTIENGLLALANTLAFDGGDLPGGLGTVMTVDLDGSTGLLSGGGTDGALQTIALNGDGTFATQTNLDSLPVTMTGFQHGITVTLGSGAQVLYGGLAGDNGIGQLNFASDGTLLGHQTLIGMAQTDQVSTLTTTDIAGQVFLFSASSSDNSITSWSVGTDGTLSMVESLGNDEDLWISAPTAMETAIVGDTTYVILGAAGSGSLSVLEVGDDGSLIIREHLLDTLGTRFDGVTTIEVITHNGQTYVIAGGADDGLSVFVLLEGGQLVARTHIADTTEMGIDNISAIAATGRGDGLDIFVASSSEVGLTQLRFDTGTAGITLTATLAGGLLAGTAAADTLQGHDGDDLIDAAAGDDIIRDGAGADTLTGGAGADVFILSTDGAIDTITDFTVGIDKIDLSLWPMLRDISQLTMSLRVDGMEIRYGDEVLIVLSADGQSIDYRDLETGDLIGAVRLTDSIESGYPGPSGPPPDLNPDPTDPRTDQSGSNNMLSGVQVLAAGNIDLLRDALNGTTPTPPTTGVITGAADDDELSGSDENDVIIAGGGDDMINGGAGDDTLLGRGGADTLNGDDGADILMGGAGDDALSGGNGPDLLQGGAGDDVLAGGLGDDVLFGNVGADTFIFNSGNDVISDFEQGLDQITLDASLWTGLTSAADVLFVYGSYDGVHATIDLGDGNILLINNVLDYSALADDIALF